MTKFIKTLVTDSNQVHLFYKALKFL